MVIRTRTAEALYFQSGERTVFGWLHGAPAGNPRIGLVICKPFGYEAICAHRSIRSFAEEAAAVGIPSLRFDYLGTGDSSDIDAAENQLDVWTKDVVVAIDELRRLTGVQHVCVLGVRLGALLALRAARQGERVQSLVLIAPIISGRKYLAELRTTRLAASLTLAAGPSREPKDDSMEVSGFTVSPATIEALKQTDLTDLDVPPAPDMLILDNLSYPIAGEWSRHLAAVGGRVGYQALPGLVAMTMTAPQFATVPTEMIDATCRWLKELESRLGVPAPATAGDIPVVGSAPRFLTLPDSGQRPDAAPRERPVFLSADGVLFGIVTEPCKSEKRRRGVILLNAGADYHIGASRMYVGLARSWAASGYFVLRMDLAGLGDSGTRPGRQANNVFPPDAVQDIRVAVEFLVAEYGIRHLTLAGLCSGAYHALRAAVAALPVNLILLINPQNFFWKEGMTINDLQETELLRGPRLYRLQMRSFAAWKKLITGKVDVGYILKVYLHRLFMQAETAGRNVARHLRIPLTRDLGGELEQVGARGVNVVFAFARGEPGLDLLKIQGGIGLKRLGRRCRIHIIDDADHIFSRKRARAAMERIISAELFSKTH